MQEQIAEVLNYVKGTLKYRWVILIITWVVCIGGWLFVSALPNKYTSEARVQIDNSTLDLIAPGNRLDLVRLLRIIQQLMYTDKNIEQIINLADLDKEIKTDRDRQKLIEKLKKAIKIIGSSDQLFNISFEAETPASAQKGLQAVLTLFSEHTNEGIFSDSEKALKFIEDQIKGYEAQLRQAEKAKEEFMRSNMLKGAVEKEGGSVADLQAVNKQLREAKIQLMVTISRKNALQEEFQQSLSEGGWETPDVLGVLTMEDEEIRALKAQLRELRKNYTDKHPAIVHLKNQIADLEKKQKSEEKEKASEFNQSILTNPYLQALKVALNEGVTQVAAAQAMVDELSQLKTNIENDLDNGLRAETELSNLNRHYATIKSAYETLLKNREDQKMSKEIDQQGTLQFKINDAPNVPLEPSSPNRKLLFSAVFVAGILLGFATAFLLYFVRPTIMSTAQIRQLIGLPILGSVSMKSSPDLIAKNKTEALKYGYASFGLVCIYVGLMTVDLFEIKVLSLSHWL